MYKYSIGNKDIYACEPQFNAGNLSFNTTLLCQASPHLKLSIPSSNTDIYACEPQYYFVNTYTNVGDLCFTWTLLC